MWKVTNKKNSFPLEQLREIIIKPFWKYLIDYKKQNTSDSFHDFIFNQNLTKAQAKAYKLMFSRSNIKEKISFSQLVEKISALDFNIITKEYKVYLDQNSQLDKLNYDISKNKNIALFKKLFTKFFYDIFFNDSEFWQSFTEECAYSKKVFHDYFMEENNIFVCPYCDLDTINDGHSKDIEHLFPKNSFPYLAMHEYNLYSSCKSCNCIANKGVKLPQYPFIAPYSIAIGEKSEFVIDKFSQSIKLYSNDNSVENYYQLVNLKNRYADKNIYRAVLNRGSFLYDIVSKRKDNDYCSVVDYLSYKQEPLTFAMNSIFKDWNKYKSEFIEKRDSIL